MAEKEELLLATESLLRDAADFLEPDGRWTKGGWAKNGNGSLVNFSDPDAVCFCVLGALYKLGGEVTYIFDSDKPACYAESLLEQRLSLTNASVAEWNDDAGRDKREVLKALRSAADSLNEYGWYAFEDWDGFDDA